MAVSQSQSVISNLMFQSTEATHNKTDCTTYQSCIHSRLLGLNKKVKCSLCHIFSCITNSRFTLRLVINKDRSVNITIRPDCGLPFTLLLKRSILGFKSKYLNIFPFNLKTECFQLLVQLLSDQMIQTVNIFKKRWLEKVYVNSDSPIVSYSSLNIFFIFIFDICSG